MKKIFIGIFILLAIVAYFWYRKWKKDQEGENDNPVYDLNPVQKTKRGFSYKALNPKEAGKMAQEIAIKFPSNLVLPDVKIDLINRLLQLQKESLIAVYWSHYNNYGKSRGYDLIWLLDNFTFLKGNKRARALKKALNTLITKRPETTKGKSSPAAGSGNVFWGLPMLLNPFK